MGKYFAYSGHYLEPEITAFDKLCGILEKNFIADHGKKPNRLELATELYMYAHECERVEAIDAFDLQVKVITRFYKKKPSQDERIEAFVLAATAELIASGEVPYAPGYRTYAADYHPIALADCDGWDQGTPEQQAKWRAMRQKYGIGGSENAAIHGISPFSNNIAVYNNKVGIEKVKNEVDKNTQFIFDYGHAMEEPIANYFAATHNVKVWNDTIMYRHPYYPWMIADLDRRAEMFNEDGTSYDALIEIKTASFKKKEQWEGSHVPEYYVSQLRHYMAVMNIDTTYICCHFGGNTADEMVFRRVKRIKSIEEMMCDVVKNFWLNNVLPLNPPVPNGSGEVQADVSYYYAKMADVDRPQIALPQSVKGVIERIMDLKEQVAQIKSKTGALGKLEDEILLNQQILKDMLGETTEGVCDCDGKTFYMVTYKPNSRASVDKEGLKIAYPDIYDRYVKENPESSRTMRISVKNKTKNWVMPQNASTTP